MFENKISLHLVNRANCPTVIDGFPIPKPLKFGVHYYRMCDGDSIPKAYLRSKKMFSQYREVDHKAKPSGKGGRVIVFISNPVNGRCVWGDSSCSAEDMFCYATGRHLAFQRAIVKDRKFHVEHTRFLNEDCSVSPFGGFTKATVDIGGHSYSGIAICSPKEQFVKKAGRELAMFRAVMAYLLGASLVSPEFGDVRSSRFGDFGGTANG